jgi:SAM-dependent methyltransferase
MVLTLTLSVTWLQSSSYAKARGTEHVLDLGCGVGRHALLFAEHGFAVEAIDGAAGLDFARREAAARGLRLSLPRPMPTRCPSPTRVSTMCYRGTSSFTVRWAMSAAVSPRSGAS